MKINKNDNNKQKISKNEKDKRIPSQLERIILPEFLETPVVRRSILKVLHLDRDDRLGEGTPIFTLLEWHQLRG